MPYLTTDDATSRGLTATAAQIAAASSVVDAYLRRPEGVVYVAEADGTPCHMAALTPLVALTPSAPLAPGLNVPTTVTGFVTQDLVGQVVVADYGTSAVEAMVVVAVAGQTLTLAQVKRAHTTPLQLGLAITDTRKLPADRPVAQVSRPQLIRLIAGQGRYSYGRRSQASPDYSLVPVLQAFTGVPIWQVFDPGQAVIDATGAVWIPSGIYGAYYSDVRLSYVAGFAQANIPEPIKAATVSILNAMLQFPELSGNLKTIQAGGTKLERFTDQALDADTRNMLAPFMARLWA